MRALRSVALVAVACFCVGPFVWQLVASLRPEGEVANLSLPRTLSLDHYRVVLVERPFARALMSSALVASATTMLAVGFGTSAAFALARLRLRWRRLILALALWASMFPPIAIVSPLYIVIRAVGLRDELAGLVLPYVGFALPLAIWVMTDYFAAIPRELYLAARIDGCTPWQAFTKVTLPLAKPGIITTGLLVFVQAWNELLFALTFTSSPEKRTVPVAIALFAAEHREPWGEIAAASVVATLPLVLATLVFQKRVVAGLTAGAVKG